MADLRATDVINGNAATAYVTIDGIMHEAFYAKSFEAKIEKTKTEVKILGQRMTKHKTTGIKGTGTMTIWYISPFYRQMLEKYKDTGVETYFTITVTNEDWESTAGANSVTFYDVSIDGGTISKFTGADDAIDEEVAFTFDDYNQNAHFNESPQH